MSLSDVVVNPVQAFSGQDALLFAYEIGTHAAPLAVRQICTVWHENFLSLTWTTSALIFDPRLGLIFDRIVTSFKVLTPVPALPPHYMYEFRYEDHNEMKHSDDVDEDHYTLPTTSTLYFSLIIYF